MTEEILDKVKKKLYDEFIEPTTHGKKDFIGIEIEIPILNLNKDAVDFNIVHSITNKFLKENTDFKPEGVDYDGNYFLLKDENTGDIISYDCSYNNIEFSMGREENLFVIHERFSNYYTFFKDEFSKYNYTLTGFGVNPYRDINNNVPIPSERYLMLYHHLCSYPDYDNEPMYFHNKPNYGMFSSASQVQLDVEYNDLIKTINVFGKLEPIKALLFSNSVLIGEKNELLCCRDMLWENSTHGVNPHNVGMYDIELEDITDLKAYLESFGIYCVMRDGKYVNFPTMGVMDYYKQESVTGEYYDDGEYKSIEITPQLDDVEYLRPFKFENLTFRGTIEYRSVCTQPIKDVMTVGAFHLGLKHNLDKIYQLFEDDYVLYHNAYTPTELRKLLVHDKLPEFINEDELYNLIRKILDISMEGLKKRGYGEEIFLEALYDRVDKRTNPAKTLLKLLDEDVPLENIIEEYGTLK